MPDNLIDINCDLGEKNIKKSPGQLEILNYISSCNIATGFHAGDPYTIWKTVKEAVAKGVAVGAHPSYPDKEGFGRISMDMSPEDLYASLVYQISALSGICDLAGTYLHHIKLHGALYHDAHNNIKVAKAVICFVQKWPHRLMIYGQSGSILEELALKNGIQWISEGFTDRYYQKDGSLVPRTHDKALVENLDMAIRQSLHIIREQKVLTIDREEVPLRAQTLCIHGDHDGSLKLAQQLKLALERRDVKIKAPKK